MLAVAGTAVGLLIPFSKLVNVVYVLIGYLGFVLLGFMLVKQLRGIVLGQKKEIPKK